MMKTLLFFSCNSALVQIRIEWEVALTGAEFSLRRAALIPTKSWFHIPGPGQSWRLEDDVLPQSLVCVRMTEADIGHVLNSIQKASQLIYACVCQKAEVVNWSAGAYKTKHAANKGHFPFDSRVFPTGIGDFPKRWRARSPLTFRQTDSLYTPRPVTFTLRESGISTAEVKVTKVMCNHTCPLADMLICPDCRYRI